MSDTDPKPDILALAIKRAFPLLQDTEAAAIAEALRLGKVHFGEGVLELQRGFDWLSRMNEWIERLLEAVDSRLRSLEYRNNFLYVYRTA